MNQKEQANYNKRFNDSRNRQEILSKIVASKAPSVEELARRDELKA
jgi:hypothetical protein